MSCCCTKIYSFCTPVSVCNPVALKALFAGLADGSYKMRYQFLDVSNYIDVTKAGAVITFGDGFELNELYIYTGQLYNADMAPLSLTVNAVAYDCFYFNTTT